MGGWLGCCCNRDSNLLTLIGVTILKRSGRELMVVIAAMFFSSYAGTEARGGAVSVDIAEGVLEGAPCDQRNPRVHLGRCHRSMLVFLSSGSLCCAIFRLVLAVAMVADMQVTAGCCNTSSCVPSTTDRDVIICCKFLALSVIWSRGLWVDEMIGNDVLETCDVGEHEVIRLPDSDSDGFVKVDDLELISNVWVCCELPSQVFFVVFEFPVAMGVYEDNCSRVSSI